MGVSLKKIAKAAGVSEATASLALNNKPQVNAETKKRICNIATEMGYIPSISAQNLTNKKSKLVGVIVPNISNLVYSTFVRGLESELRKHDYKMIMATSESNIAYEEEMIKHFISFRVEGAIIYPLIKDNPDPKYLNMLTSYNIPFVFIGSYYNGINAPHVMSDIYGAISNATEYLYDTGARNFYYFGGCKTIVSNDLKFRAIRDTLANKGIIFEDSHYIELQKTNYQCAYEQAIQLLSQHRKIDAALAGDVYTSMAVYNALREYGFKVPDDVSLISFDNLLPPEVCKVPLTCIEQNSNEIVHDTVDILLQKMAGNHVNKNILVNTKLIIRETTKNI